MKIYAFPRGGLVIDAPSVPPRGSVAEAFLPVLSVLPVSQHPGGRVLPLVNPGDTVREGMLIGRASGHGAVNMHATVPGKVIRKVTWKDCEGTLNEGLLIRMEGSFDRLGRREDPLPWADMGSPELRQLIADCGIVEMEGSGRSVAEMTGVFSDAAEPGSLVIRCVFDDPWLAADYALCRERLEAVVEGSFITARAAGQVNRVVFAVSAREQELGTALLAESAKRDLPASLVLTGSRYPQRNRRELELVLRNYEKKENDPLGSLLMLGPATMAAVHDAVRFKQPVLDRYVAVGGSAVKNPQVMKVRIGKRIGELFDECGGFIGKPKRVATGAPLAGRAVMDLDEPVLKTSYAVFALLKAHTGDCPERDCIGCGECRCVCPVGLDPEELFKRMTGPQATGSGPATEGSPPAGAGECHGCGCCDVVCPSRLPLSGVIRGDMRRKRRA